MTRKRFFLFALIVFCLALPVAGNAQSTSGERIDSYKADIVVNQDSSLEVTEVIDYDFGTTQRHGIYRYIPYTFDRDGSSYTTDITISSVTDDTGLGYAYTTSKSGGFIDVKIGNPDKLITDKHTYVIAYTVKKAINYFKDHDELYWNVTGNDWDVPIDSAFAFVEFPQGADESNTKSSCYTGVYGSAATDCTINWDKNGLGFSANNPFSAKEGLSIVVAIPKGVVAAPTAADRFWESVQKYWSLILPLIAFVIMHILWLKHGQDPKFNGPVIPEYEPPEAMLPSLMGTLWDEKADMRDISATIIHLAIKGYLKIKNTGKKNYEFIRLEKGKDDLSALSEVERKVLEGIFTSTADVVSLDSLKNKFYTNLPDIKAAMYQSLVDKKYFVSNPSKVKAKYYVTAGIIGFILLFTGILVNPVAIISGVLTVGIVLIYARIMPQKTKHGAEAKIQVKGFRWFLSVTEEERLKFHNAPEKKPEQFMEFLPYAMVLGVESQWAKQFKDMYIEAPSWYEGQPGTVFSAIYFGSVLSSMNSNMSSTFTSHPSSAGSGGSGFGGGGFSGGGFGGGGGGSW